MEKENETPVGKYLLVFAGTRMFTDGTRCFTYEVLEAPADSTIEVGAFLTPTKKLLSYHIIGSLVRIADYKNNSLKGPFTPAGVVEETPEMREKLMGWQMQDLRAKEEYKLKALMSNPDTIGPLNETIEKLRRHMYHYSPSVRKTVARYIFEQLLS